MSANPFDTDSLVPTWAKASEILKGDVQGHDFHGNQYEQVGGSGGGQEPTYKVKFRADYLGEGEASVEAYVGDKWAGFLKWNYLSESPEIVDVSVEPQFQRQGIATNLYKEALKNESQLVHSQSLTPDGEKWVQSIQKGDVRGHEFHGNQYTTDQDRLRISLHRSSGNSHAAGAVLVRGALKTTVRAASVAHHKAADAWEKAAVTPQGSPERAKASQATEKAQDADRRIQDVQGGWL